MIGRILSNRYKLIDDLGSGGMAWVYLARDLLDGQQVAVKVLYAQLGQDPDFVRRFVQEARLAMALSQDAAGKQVVPVLDYGSDQDTHYLVMEYVAGRNLRQVLGRDGHLAWERALSVARQVSQALQHAHEHGIVHRDVKPENIMLLDGDQVRVLDFGVARARTSPTLTHSGFVGSPYYVAPEQAMGRTVDIRADIYSLGIVLYEMLSGQLPFQSDTPWIVVNHHIATPPPPLEEINPDLPHAVIRLVRKALSKRPEDRFQTPAEMALAIDAILAGTDPAFDSGSGDQATLEPLLASLYQQGQQAVLAEEWQEAVDHFSQVLKFDPRYRDVAERLAEAGRQARLAALYAAARRAMKGGHWSEASTQLAEIAETDGNYRDVQALVSQARHKHELQQLYQQGMRHVEAGEWRTAVQYLSRVHDREPGYSRVAEMLSLARTELDKTEAAPTPARRVNPPRERRRSLAWVVVAVLIVALAVESYLFYRAQQPQALASVTASDTPTATAGVGDRPTATQAPALPATSTGPAAPTADPLPTRPPQDTPTASPPPTRPRRHTPTAGPEPTQTASGEIQEHAATVPVPRATAPVVPASARPGATSPAAAGGQPGVRSQIAFPRFDPQRETYDVYTCTVDRSATTASDCRLLAGEGSQPQLLPGGAQLVYHSWRSDDRGLMFQGVDGQGVWRITGQIEAARPSVDFQGKRYVLHSRSQTDRQPRLYRTDAAELVPVLREANEILGVAPAWTPDGRILYSGCLGDDCGILVMRVDGSQTRQVVPGTTELNAEASPDGQRLAFMSQRDGNWEVYVADLGDATTATSPGSGLQRLTNHPANDGLPTWSPDGRYLAFVSNRDGAWAIWVMRPDGSEKRRLLALGGALDGRVRSATPHENQGWTEERISWSLLPTP